MTNFERISKKQFDDDFSGYINIEHEEIKIPRRATSGSAGYDFFTPVAFTLKPGKSIKIPTGIRIILPEDKFLMVLPRSGLGFKYRIQLDNTAGIIDSDYAGSDNEGHIWLKITNDSKERKKVTVNKGDAIAQGIILQYFKTDDDDADAVRNGGFGSTSQNQ